MDLYHSRLTPDDLNDLIIKYKIPRDLHPRLPLEEFVMSELPDDAIGIYHQIFDFFGVRIHFSSFLLALIKHYRVHFSQLGPLGLNRVITFEVLCRSLQIEPTVTLFRVFQTLCKQGDWFSFSKRRAPSPVCIDDNRSCMKHWKSGFFLIDRRAIPDAMVWRHPDAAIDDPRPTAGSFNMADVRRLSAHVIKLRDMPEGVLALPGLIMGIYDFLCLPEWIGAAVQDEPHLDVRPTLQRLPFYCTPHAAANAIISNPTLEDLAVGTPSSKIVAKAEASHKQKASTSGAASSHVAKRDSDDESDGDDDACVKIPLVTLLRSVAVIPPSGNQVWSSAATTAEGSNTKDSRGKGVMVDDVVAPSGDASRQRPSSGPALAFRDVSGDAIHTDFFSFSAGPYYAFYPEDGVAGNYEFTREEWNAPYRPTFGVLTKELTAKMSVLHCMMMSHGGELLARYHGLNKSHHEYVLSTDSRLKGYEEKVAGLIGLELQVSTLKKQVSGLYDKLATSDASFAKSKILYFEVKRDEEILGLKDATLKIFPSSGAFQTKDKFADVLKKMVNFMPGAQERLAEASPLVAQIDYAFLNKISEYAVEPLSVILQLESKKLVRPTNVPIPRDTRVSPPITKELTVTPVSKSLELSANVVPASFVVALEENEEQVSAAVDGSDLEMTDGAAHSKSEGVFVQGTSHVLDDIVEMTMVGSERVSFGLTDVVVALSAGEKGDGSAPSTVEEVVVPPFGV
ncbi:hypothetical protein Tco_1095384 [Tanacetum coccineum]